MAILLSIVMVVGLLPGVGTMKVSAAEGEETAAGVTFTALDGNPEGFNEGNDERYHNLFDGTATTKWCCEFINPSYVIFKASQPIYVSGYTIWTGNDTGENPGRNPTEWTLSACNDYDETNKSGGTWQTIDTVTDGGLRKENLADTTFTIPETETTYRYFKLNITRIDYANTMQLGELALSYRAKSCETHDWAYTRTVAPTCTEDGYDVETCSNCGQVQHTNQKPALGHTFENGSCTVCGSGKVQFTATAGTDGVSESEGYAMLLDKKYSSTDIADYSKWCVDHYHGDAYIIFAASDPINVKGYTIVTGDDNEEYGGRNPKNWTLYGCNAPEANSESGRDSGSWQIIHSVSDDTVLQDMNYTPYTFTLDAPTATKYQYFKLEITEIQDQNACVMQMSEFILDYSYCEHNWVKTETTIPPTCTEGGYDVYQCSICHATNNVANGSTAEHTWVKGESVAPTCAEDGYTPQTCSNCGATQKTGIIPALGHDFDNRQCTRCGVSDTALSRPKGDGTVESPYRISTVGELTWFAGLVNGTLDGAARNTSANAVLTTDIDFGNNNFAAIGTEAYPFSGTFDGSGHTITVNQNGSSDVALFGYLGNCTVKNLTVTGTIRTTEKFAAGIAMQTKTGTTATVENCVSNVTIESSIDGDGTHGGLIGMPQGAVNINNCAFTGAINGASTDSCGGMIGYAKGNVTIKNSYIAATFNLNETSCHTFSRDFATWVKLENCYYLNALGEVPANATQLTSEQFSSGEAAYRLQGEQTEAVWGQTLGENGDPYPVLGGMKVYKNETTGCIQITYSNTQLDPVNADHTDSDSNGVCDTCGAKIAYIITGRILDEAGQTINGDMQGLANYKPEEKVTLTAPVIAGYNFIGWYAYASESPFYTGDNLCTSRTYTFTAEEDRDLVAVYKAIGSAELTISGGKDFTINGAKKTTDVTTSYPMGSQITVVCNDSDFGYWKNSAGMVVSRNQSYTFTVTGKESISAVFNTIAKNQVTVVFESSYGQVIARDQYASDAAITDPGLPFRYGYTALGWDYNGDGSYDAEADTFAKALERGFDSPENLVTILPVYQLNNVTYKITVEGGTGAGIYKQNDVVTVEANAASEGMKFSHWVDKAGTILSYNEKYQFYAAKDITVTAVYVADTTEVEAKGTTEIIDMSADTANGKLTFVSMSTVPEGCTINKAGIIATNIEGVGTSGDGFNADTAAYVRGNAWTGNAYRFTWTKSKVASNETWYVRAHLVYTDAEGNVHTVYGDMVSQTMPASNQQ